MKKLMKGLLPVTLLVLAACTGKAPADDATSAFKHKQIYKEITPEIIATIKDEDLEQAIFDNIAYKMSTEPGGLMDKMATLTAGQRSIYVTWIIEEQVRIGGLKQFYKNFGETLAAYAKEAFETIDATEYATIIEQCNAIYAVHKIPPPKAVEDPYEKQEDAFEKLTDESEVIDMEKVKFIREHAADFTSVSRGR